MAKKRAKPRNKQTVSQLRDQYAKINSLYNLAVQREQVQFTKLAKLQAAGKRFTDKQAAAAQHLRKLIEYYARERDRLLQKIQSLGG